MKDRLGVVVSVLQTSFVGTSEHEPGMVRASETGRVTRLRENTSEVSGPCGLGLLHQSLRRETKTTQNC